MPDTEHDRLLDMLDAINKALEFTVDKAREELDQNDMLSLALVRLLKSLAKRHGMSRTRLKMPILK